MKNANFIFVGPTVPFGEKNPLYSVFTFFLFPHMSSNDKHKNPERIYRIFLIKCSKCNLIRSTAPTLSANASCHTSMFS